MSKKQPNFITRQTLTFYEPCAVIFPLLLGVLRQAKWISKRELSTGASTLMKLASGLTAVVTITQYDPPLALGLSVPRRTIGDQEFLFTLVPRPRGCWLEVATQVTITSIAVATQEKRQWSKLKHHFRDFVRNLDTQLRDEMDRQKLHSYF